MCCEQIERQLGRYIDDELSPERRQEIEAHLAFCSSCQTELEELRGLTRRLAMPTPISMPDTVWRGVEHRLDGAEKTDSAARPHRRFVRGTVRWAVAAGVFIAVGVGLFTLSSVDTPARASSVDFSVLLDALPLDARKAFTKFLIRYDARPTTPVAAKRFAPYLNFETPEELPGGFRLASVYTLRIGGQRGVAAAYERDGEFLAAVFHPPMEHERFGGHANYPCVIGAHCGHKVQVGAWKLVHLTDPTTCHCLLSRLDEKSEIPAVMASIAPQRPSDAGAAHPGHHHP